MSNVKDFIRIEPWTSVRTLKVNLLASAIISTNRRQEHGKQTCKNRRNRPA